MAKLLIVDDEKDLCWVFQRIFQEEGHSVATATTGQEGIAKARVDQPDLIFLDLKMPSMDGITCLKRLRTVSKVSKVVVLTGYGTLKTAKEAMRLGAYDYTAKPFDLDLIRDLIQEVASVAGR
ncbi:MAG: response regulator [Candidatus Omnitrophica bacterium]|nr:response regulator [Candidatus Omnitrophota bacterium]